MQSRKPGSAKLLQLRLAQFRTVNRISKPPVCNLVAHGNRVVEFKPTLTAQAVKVRLARMLTTMWAAFAWLVNR